MSLSNVTNGIVVGPQIHTIAGINGVGKTTFACSFPKSLILDLEDGSLHINANRIRADKLRDLQSFKSYLKLLKTEAHDFQTLVIDSAEALEALIENEVCKEGKVETIEKYDGGYGKGWQRAKELMRETMIELQELKSRGITSILVAHTQVKQVSDPATNQSYDRVIMRCNDKMAAIIRDLSDNVFYATYKVFTAKDSGKTKAFGDGQRIMFTQWRPGFDAKNRLELPLELPLSYEAFSEACKLKPESNSEEILNDIQEMSKNLDAVLKKQVQEQLEKFKGNPAKLKEIKNRLMKYVA